MPDNHFDELIAARYDDDVATMFAPEILDPTVAFLAQLAGDGPVLELGIGTGRVALPLHQRGLEVVGIELSPDMVSRLRAKPRAEGLEVVLGDFAATRFERSFSLVFLVFNTIMNLTSQDEQVACFVNAAAHLDPGGFFVVETLVPRRQELPRGQTLQPFAVSPDHLGFDEIDVATQSLVSHHHRYDGDRCERSSIPFRYVWPSELDLMARIAGLALVERWENWHREPFTSSSRQHVSVWRKEPEPASRVQASSDS